MGQTTLPQWHAFHEQANGKLLLSQGIAFSSHDYELLINMERLQFMHQSGFGIANHLLSKKQLTDLEERCLEAISHYAHGVASLTPQDRLLHALVAVESLLLRDSNEPVQGPLSLRIARLATSKLEERKKAVRDFVKGYKLRSQFVHHGARPDDVETANRVLLLCWAAIEAVMKLTKKFESKLALLDGLEDEFLSG